VIVPSTRYEDEKLSVPELSPMPHAQNFGISTSGTVSVGCAVPNSQHARRIGKGEGDKLKRLPSCAVTHLYF
jgi:hypothetical protein